MEDKFVELKYVQAKEALIDFINNIPIKYGISFILIDEMLIDIKNQVRASAINDRKTLELMLLNSTKKEEKKDKEIDE
jgi:hypothetical protein